MGDLIVLLGVFVIGIITAFIGSIAGSGGLISIPALIFFGLSPQGAIATGKFGGLGLNSAAAVEYGIKKKINFNHTIALSIISLIGAIIGANILLQVSEKYLSLIIGIIIAAFIPILLKNKNFGLKNKKVTKHSMHIGYILFFFVAIFAGFFGGGSATLAMYVFMLFFGYDIIESAAAFQIPGVIINITSIFIFGLNGIINLQFAFALFFGTIIGGFMGAKTAVEKGNKWVRMFFMLIVIISAVKLLLF